MTVLVTGATGFIGRHLLGELLSRAETVRALSRDPSVLPSDLRKLVQTTRGDLVRPSSLREAFDDINVVFHLAGELRESSQFATVNVDGTRNLLEACNQAGVRRLIHLSSVGVMGPQPAGKVTEAAPCHPDNEYERSKFEAECIVRNLAERYGMRLTVIRPTIVFGDGPRRGADSMFQWLQAIWRGRFVYMGHGGVANYIYVGDLVRACIEAASRLDDVSGTFIASDSCSLEDFVGAAADGLGVRRPRLRLPLAIAFPVALGLQTIAPLSGRNSPLTVNRVRALSSRTHFSADKIRKELGFVPTLGYREGLARTIEWHRKAGNFV